MKHSSYHHPIQSSRPTLCAFATLYSSLMFALGCATDEDAQRLGFTNDNLAASNDPTPAATAGEFLGRWRGRASDLLELQTGSSGAPPLYQFPSGSSDITLEIGLDTGIFSSTLVFGSAPPPPVTSAFDSYPPGTTLLDYDRNPPALEGARYDLSLAPFSSEIAAVDRPTYTGGFYSGPAMSLADADGTLRFLYLTSDAYRDWCAAQPSLPSTSQPGLFNCLGARGVAESLDDGKCYSYDDEQTDFYSSELGEGVIPDPAREVDCARAYACMDQCVCVDPDYYADLGIDLPAPTCTSSGDALGALWLRKTGDDLVGVFTGEAGFVNARGARTMLGQIRFERIAEPETP